LQPSTGKEAIRETVIQAQEELAHVKATAAAAARRRTILAGLQDLGYRVHEGLSTVTPSAGRLVLRVPGSDGYGVEVISSAGSDKMQVRTVAFDASRDSSGDIAAETAWCGDFSKLRTVLQGQGCGVVVEKALGIGTVPLKVVETGEEEQHRKVNVLAQKSQRG
jgi:hypothetical protein